MHIDSHTHLEKKFNPIIIARQTDFNEGVRGLELSNCPRARGRDCLSKNEQPSHFPARGRAVSG